MLGISVAEILVVIIVALVVLGPKQLIPLIQISVQVFKKAQRYYQAFQQELSSESHPPPASDREPPPVDKQP